MSYVIQAVLSNAQHPEYGQVTIPFPIPNQNYDCTIELLEPLEIGDTLRQDCQVDELDSFYTVLNALIGTQVTLDELDYLAKRLDSFDDGEAAQFQGMAHKLGLSKIKDLINLTFCCQKATVITDFSDLEKIGREHYMNLNGGCARTEDLEALDGTETAYLLIDSGAGTVTPYGVAYDNSMKLEPLYNGRQFPEYLYDNSSMGLKIVPAENQAPELLWLPASEQQIRRTLLRAGWQDPDHADYTIDVFLLQKEAGRILNEKRDSLHSLNAMCGAIAKLEQKDRDKLEAVIVFAEPENAGAIRRLAENLEQFDFIPGIHTPEEYGRYMIRESGRFEYDDRLLFCQPRAQPQGGVRRFTTFPQQRKTARSPAPFSSFPFSHQRHIADAVERFKRLDLLVQRRFAVHPKGERAAHGAAALLLRLAEEVQVPNVVSVALYLADDLADRALFLHLEIHSGNALRLADAKVHAPQHLHRKEDERIADDAARVKTRAERRADDGDRPQARRGRQAAHLLIARH